MHVFLTIYFVARNECLIKKIFKFINFTFRLLTRESCGFMRLYYTNLQRY